MKKAIVVIPTYNERENVSQLIPDLLQVFQKVKHWDMQVLIVDDTSPDKTYEVVRAFGKKHKNVHLLLNKQKAGLGAAYMKGMDYAFDTLGAEVVFEFDADFSHDMQKIPALLREIELGADLALGSRYIQGGGIPDNWGAHRKLLSRGGNLVIMAVLTNFQIKDWTSGFRALRKSVFQAVKPHLKGNRFEGYTFQIGFLYTALKLGFTVTEHVAYKFVDRTHGHSKLGPEYIVNNLLFLFKMRALELISSKLFKFALVGGVGTLVQLSSLFLYRTVLPDFSYGLLSTFMLSTFLSIETAIVSNFLLNNLWTFKEQTLKLQQIPMKFFAFNLASAGSLGLQLAIAATGKLVFGLFPLFTLPVLQLEVDTGTMYVLLGIFVGMFWNFFAYTTFIWNKKPAASAA